ncbi:MAG: Na+/H+ antiporter NhaA [Candidatus Hodarchaeota archaeon]
MPRRLSRAQLRRLYAPFQRFFRLEASSSILLIISITGALIWANSLWGFSYFALWETPLTIAIGSFVISEPLRWWINEGLMALFFFVVGLEIKRAVIVGELSRVQDALFPIFAALGGMIVPAIFFTLINFGSTGAIGWPVPMATDIALALGVLALLGSKIPLSLKLFLSTLAIADDIGSVIIIAGFYSAISPLFPVIVGALLIVGLVLINRMGIQSTILYATLALGVWLSFLLSGIHTTLAGILVATTIPVKARVNTEDFCSKSHVLLKDFEDAKKPGESVLTNKTQRSAVLGLEAICKDVQTPLQRMEYLLQPWVGYAIVPIFALANAGVLLAFDITVIASGTVALGVIIGLVLGKQLGIVVFSWASVRMGLANKPKDLSWRQIHAVSCLGGIGFTMSLFMADLTFSGHPLLDISKIAILLASLIAGLLGFFLLGGMKMTSTLVRQKFLQLKVRLGSSNAPTESPTKTDTASIQEK